MKTYRVWGSDYLTDTPVQLEILNGPWWTILGYNLCWGTTIICDILYTIKLPKFIKNWKKKWGDEPGWPSEECTFEEYYGDDFSVFWHLTVESWAINKPLQYFENHPRLNKTFVNVSLEEAEKLNGSELDWIRKGIIEAKLEQEKEQNNEE